MPSQNEIRQTITDQIIAALTAGTAPWRRPWSSDPCAGSPKNAVSGKSYSGVNPLLLSLAAEHHGLKSRYWATYRQWQDLGGQVMGRPKDVPVGTWGTHIVFCKPCTKKSRDDNGKEVEDKFWMLRTFTVFNVDQVSGATVDRFRVGQQETSSTDLGQRFEQADELITATGADIRYGGDRAFYQPQGDFIQLPHRQQFVGGEWYETAFHELAHWTEHISRLNWDRSKPENTYALGELIAELSSCYTSAELGLPLQQSLGNHAAYLKHWIEQMRGDSRFIFRATSQASRATDFLLSFVRTPEAVEDEDSVLVA